MRIPGYAAAVSSPTDDDSGKTPQTSDRLGYTVAMVLFIGGGILLTTPVLNWICGPALIVASVVVVGRVQDRLAARRARSRP